jgi:hypothetical protein
MGHITFVSFDLLQVEIDSPYSDLRDGYYNDFAEIPEKYWYVRDNQITTCCLKDAKKLLQLLVMLVRVHVQMNRNPEISMNYVESSFDADYLPSGKPFSMNQNQFEWHTHPKGANTDGVYHS